MRHYFCLASTPRQEQGERQGVIAFTGSKEKICACAFRIDSK